MSDRFLFRAWHKKYKTLYEVLHLHKSDIEGLWVTVRGRNCIEHKDINIQIQPKDFVIMQCTGLKDKNGKLIYEGDILHAFNLYVYIVIFIDGCFCVRNIESDSKWDEELYICAAHTTVVGNIYENPELFESEDES